MVQSTAASRVLITRVNRDRERSGLICEDDTKSFGSAKRQRNRAAEAFRVNEYALPERLAEREQPTPRVRWPQPNDSTTTANLAAPNPPSRKAMRLFSVLAEKRKVLPVTEIFARALVVGRSRAYRPELGMLEEAASVPKGG